MRFVYVASARVPLRTIAVWAKLRDTTRRAFVFDAVAVFAALRAATVPVVVVPPPLLRTADRAAPDALRDTTRRVLFMEFVVSVRTTALIGFAVVGMTPPGFSAVRIWLFRYGYM